LAVLERSADKWLCQELTWLGQQTCWLSLNFSVTKIQEKNIRARFLNKTNFLSI
jgi:hypothetical protein